jgi:hypothetical protein
VIEFEIKYLHEFEPTPITLEQAENFTVDFLQTHNYSIPNNARYIEGFPYDCQRFYSLVFQEYVGPVMIEESRIIVRASAFTQGVGYFQHHWFGLNDIDISGIMGPDLVKLNLQTRLQQERILFPQFENETNIVWDEPLLQMVEVTEDDAKLHRLSWVMNIIANTTDEFEARFYIDAFTGNLYGFRSSESAYTEVEEHLTIYSSTNLQNIVTISSMFLGASIIGLVVYGVRSKSQLT